MTTESREATEPGWYAVRCVFQDGPDVPIRYEERITLWRATSFAEAIALAKDEAADYVEGMGWTYCGLAQAYHLSDEPGHGAEVYSLMRDSDLAPEAYLSAFFDTGRERQGTVTEPATERPG